MRDWVLEAFVVRAVLRFLDFVALAVDIMEAYVALRRILRRVKDYL